MKLLIAVPCMDMVHTIFMKSLLGLRRPEGTRISMTGSSLVYDARNRLVTEAITDGFDRILWLDSDMEFPADLCERLMADMDEGRDFVAGCYFKRVMPTAPVFYQKVGYWRDEEKDTVTPLAVPYADYPLDQIFQVEGAGFGGAMVSVDLCRKVQDKFGLPFSPILGFGEDLSFCVRARQLGATLYCDSRIKLGHVGLGTVREDTYLKQHTPLTEDNHELAERRKAGLAADN